MGILIFYEGDGRIAGDVPAEQWKQIRRLIPLAIDLINVEMGNKQSQPKSEKLVVAPIRAEKLMRDEWKSKEEINLLDSAEWDRLLAWWTFLTPVVEGMRFYAPVLEILKKQTKHPDQPHA